MKIQITKELKIKLLQALKAGYIETADFPELSEYMKNLTDEELDARIAELERKYHDGKREKAEK